MYEWHSEQERRPWEEDKNFLISIDQERFGRVSTKDDEVEQDGPRKRNRMSKNKKQFFDITLLELPNPGCQFSGLHCIHH